MVGHLPSDMVHLRDAAALAHRRIFWRAGELSDELRDAIALALSARLEVYGTRYPGAMPIRLTRDDYRAGAFRSGAARFELADGTVMQLAVRKADFTRLLDWLVTLGLFRTPPAL